MRRYEAIEKALRNAIKRQGFSNDELHDARAALALPEDSKVVNAELYGLAVELADTQAKTQIEYLCKYGIEGYQIRKVNPNSTYIDPIGRAIQQALRYLSLREASGEPMPYKVVRDGDKVRFL